MSKYSLEVIVGIFVLIGILALAYLAVQLGEVEILQKEYYRISASFDSVAGLKPGATVEIAGVPIGTVERISLQDYQASVVMRILSPVKIQEDAIASIVTQGIIGDKYIQITPGGSEQVLGDGGKIRDTESALSLEGLIRRYVFGKMEPG
jgi:phospholipid/cholesterol/gamma-HCH transport system substrate-binding protein